MILKMLVEIKRSFILIKKNLILQEDRTIINTYVPNNKNIKIYKAKTDEWKRKESNNNTWRLKQPSFNNGWENWAGQQLDQTDI